MDGIKKMISYFRWLKQDGINAEGRFQEYKNRKNELTCRQWDVVWRVIRW